MRAFYDTLPDVSGADWSKPDTRLCLEFGVSRSTMRRLRIAAGVRPLAEGGQPKNRNTPILATPVHVGLLGTEIRLSKLKGMASMWI